MQHTIMPRQNGKATLLRTLIKIQEMNMQKHMGTGKIVKKAEWYGANKVKVTYADLSSEELTRKEFEQVIKTVKGAE